LDSQSYCKSLSFWQLKKGVIFLESFDTKRFLKGFLIVMVLSLIIGLGRGLVDTIHFLSLPRNVFNDNSIQVDITPTELAHGSYTYADLSSSISYQLDNGQTGSFMPFDYSLFDEERRQIVDNISNSSGHSFRWIQIGMQHLPFSKICFSLVADSSASVKVFLVKSSSYLYGIPEENQAVTYKLTQSNSSYEVEVPRMYAQNSSEQWTYASFYSVVISLEDGEVFSLKNMRFSAFLQRTTYDEISTLLQ
jgi:hypothetical protein